MKSTVIQIRDIERIEKELNVNKVGLLGLFDKNENLSQTVLPFLYANKNIYIFFESDDELFVSIVFDAPVKFTVLRSEIMKKNSSTETQSLFKYLQITFNGNIKLEDDRKIIDELYKEYLQRFNFNSSKLNDGYLDTLRVVYLDTEEIDATEVTGA
ncbi:MAG: hypothetical protein Q8933_14345 [Bacteroidota bacterium]|nr:hypothetical protein [Bacteroidota bacterium]MDP4192095.1 hypothetical protein [Bacteroidota bacterium]MDP4196930.1 hypothetical protein [Bacteroidota bacterium]